MKYWTLTAIIILLTSCGGNLSDEQRKKLHERMKEDEIRHITEGELTSAAFDYGRAIIAVIEKKDPSMTNTELIDSLENAFDVKITTIEPGDSLLLAVESRLIEAYATGVSGGRIGDDIQKMGNDSILYTKPILIERPDGTIEFVKAVSIHMPSKSVVLSIKD